jgi:hypothetical protein
MELRNLADQSCIVPDSVRQGKRVPVSNVLLNAVMAPAEVGMQSWVRCKQSADRWLLGR